MSVEFAAGANSGATDNDSSQSVTVPATVQAGDVAVLFADRWNGSASFSATTGPTGAVERFTSPIASNGGNNVQTSVYLLRLSGESSLAVTWSGFYWSTLGALFWTGVDPAVDLATVPIDSTSATDAATAPDVSVTATAGSGLAFDFNGEGDPTPDTYTPPTGYTHAAVMDSQASSYRVAAGGGTQTASGATVDPAQGVTIATLVALPPATSGGGSETYSGNGAAVDLDVGYGAGTGAATERGSGSGDPLGLGLGYGTGDGGGSETGAGSGGPLDLDLVYGHGDGVASERATGGGQSLDLDVGYGAGSSTAARDITLTASLALRWHAGAPARNSTGAALPARNPTTVGRPARAGWKAGNPYTQRET